jgi:hypothetical protein
VLLHEGANARADIAVAELLQSLDLRLGEADGYARQSLTEASLAARPFSFPASTVLVA